MTKKTTKTNRKSNGISGIIKILAVIILTASLAILGYRLHSSNTSDAKAERVMTQLENIVPGIGQDTGISTGLGREPLAAVSIEGTDIVGVLEVPSLDIFAPVKSSGTAFTEDNDRASDYDIEQWFATYIGGSPVRGHFMIAAGRLDLFSSLASLSPGDRVSFTDIDGTRYNYQVTTQYHLKKWDTGENELMLCYETDSDTYFVVGCNSTQ